MSPEQCGSESVGPPADQYSLATVAYELLTGKVPFTASGPTMILLAQMQPRRVLGTFAQGRGPLRRRERGRLGA